MKHGSFWLGPLMLFPSSTIITPTKAYELVWEDFNTICHIPSHIRNKAFMKTLWLNRGYIKLFNIDFFLKYAPRSLFDREFCRECIANFPTAKVISFFPRRYLTRTFWETALKQDGLLIKHIPPSQLNQKLLTIAVSNNAVSLKYIPEEFKTTRLSSLGIRKDIRVIAYAAFKS